MAALAAVRLLPLSLQTPVVPTALYASPCRGGRRATRRGYGSGTLSNQSSGCFGQDSTEFQNVNTFEDFLCNFLYFGQKVQRNRKTQCLCGFFKIKTPVFTTKLRFACPICTLLLRYRYKKSSETVHSAYGAVDFRAVQYVVAFVIFTSILGKTSGKIAVFLMKLTI